MVKSFDRKPWTELATTAPTLPGGAALQVTTLLEVLRSFAGLHESPLTHTPEARDQILKQIGSLGFTFRSAGNVLVSDLGNEWLADPNEEDLFRIMHSRLAYFGEALTLISEGPTSVEDVALDAASRYSMAWKSLDQVRRRLAWFQALGLVDCWQDRKYRITDRGRAVLDSVQVQAPEDVREEMLASTEGSALPAAPPLLQEALSQLDPSSRHLASFPYLTAEPVAALQLITEMGLTGTTKEKVANALCERFNIAASSAKTTVDVAGQFELYRYSDREEIKTTPLGREWFENANSANLVRLLHLKLLAIGETLMHIDDTPRTTSEVHTRLYHGVKDAPNKTRTSGCIKLLTEAGAVTQLGYARHVITRTGRQLAASLPLAELARSSDEPTSSLPSPPKITNEAVEAIASELVEASRDSNNPGRFEKATAAAFSSLNVEAHHLGGPGRTDVLVTVESNLKVIARAIIDAKSTAGQLSETSIKFDALREHAHKHEATLMAVVAPSFEGSGRLVDWARDNNVVLFTADELAEILRSDRSLPYSASDIAKLLTIDGKREVDEQRAMELTWLRNVASVVAELAAESVQEEAEPIGARDIGRVLRREDTPISDNEVGTILQFLGLPEIGAVQQQANATYTLPSSPRVAANRLRTIANAVDRLSV